MISHSIGEIFKLSDQVIVIDKGKIIKEGTPHTVFTAQKVSKIPINRSDDKHYQK